MIEVVRPNRRPKASSSSSHSGTFKVETYVARDQSRHLYWVSPEALINTSRKPAAKEAPSSKKATSKKEVISKAKPGAAASAAPAKKTKQSSVTPAKHPQVKGLKNGAQATSSVNKEVTSKIAEVPESAEDKQILRGPMPDAFRQQFPALMRHFRPNRAASI